MKHQCKRKNQYKLKSLFNIFPCYKSHYLSSFYNNAQKKNPFKKKSIREF